MIDLDIFQGNIIWEEGESDQVKFDVVAIGQSQADINNLGVDFDITSTLIRLTTKFGSKSTSDGSTIYMSTPGFLFCLTIFLPSLIGFKKRWILLTAMIFLFGKSMSSESSLQANIHIWTPR